MSPAGYWPQLRAAIEAGADACYFGLHHFSARAKVGFTLEELPEVMRTLHGRGVRGYLTFNTLVFDHEIDAAARAVEAAAKAGVDALIVQDIGVLKMVREMAPGLELHASTQTSITSAEGVEFALGLGVERVTLARELSIEEVAAIYDRTGAELEIFVHGALCVAYSGQCFSSEAWGGRSANRGQCAQACRLEYEMVVDGAVAPLGDARYLLSPGDLSGLRHVPQIVEAGVSSLKIEGRYKEADYVALTTRAYRQAVDDAWAGRETRLTRADELRLEQVYSRGLGPFFLSGVNHQAVVRGRAPRHRGVAMGRVARVYADGVAVEPGEAHQVAPLKAGDGLVFDAADWRSPSEPEEGGRVYEVLPELDGTLLLRFGNGAVRFDRIRAGDLVWRTQDAELAKAARPFVEADGPVARQVVRVRVMGEAGRELASEWTLERDAGVTVRVGSGFVLAAAEKRGLEEAGLRAQLGRLGNTPYELGELRVELVGNVFAPVSALNQMRREAVERLQERQTRVPEREIRPRRTAVHTEHEGNGEPEIHLLVRTPEQLDAALELDAASVTLDYLDLYGLRPSVERVKAAGMAVRVASPRVLKPGEGRIAQFLVSLECPIVVRATGVLQALQEAGRVLIGDFSLNTANVLTAEAYLEMGLARLTPTHDLNAAQVAELARRIGPDRVEAIAYQHLPVFHTEHCVFCRFLSEGTTHRDCGRPCEEHRVALRDRQGRAHPVMADVGCRNTIFGAEAQEASAHLSEWLGAGIRHFRLEFVHESGDEVRQVTQAFAAALHGDMGAGALGAVLRRIAPEGTTEGSLFVPKDYKLFPILQ
jgi:putative protease